MSIQFVAAPRIDMIDESKQYAINIRNLYEVDSARAECEGSGQEREQ
jgi:hypothetical protein